MCESEKEEREAQLPGDDMGPSPSPIASQEDVEPPAGDIPEFEGSVLENDAPGPQETEDQPEFEDDSEEAEVNTPPTESVPSQSTDDIPEEESADAQEEEVPEEEVQEEEVQKDEQQAGFQSSFEDLSPESLAVLDSLHDSK